VCTASRNGDRLYDFNAFTARVCNLNPTSRGPVHLKRSRFDEAPAIAPDSLDTSEDRQVAADSLRLTRRIVGRRALLARVPTIAFAGRSATARLRGRSVRRLPEVRASGGGLPAATLRAVPGREAGGLQRQEAWLLRPGPCRCGSIDSFGAIGRGSRVFHDEGLTGTGRSRPRCRPPAGPSA